MGKKIDLKDLNNFKGNDSIPADWKLRPVDRKKKVSDIPKLGLHEVNVTVDLGENNKITGERVKETKLCCLDKLPDHGQFEELLKYLDKVKNKSRSKAKVVSSDGTLVSFKTLKNLIDKFLVDVAWEFKDFKSYRQRLSYWKKELGDLPLEEVTTGLIKSHKILLKKEGKKPATVK